MDAKKISFGFSKIKKGNLTGPSAIVPKQLQSKDKIELISCLEGQTIKIVGKENEDDKPAPLVIPLREQDKTTIPDRLAKLQDIIEGKDTEENGVKNDVEPKAAAVGNESLEQRAAREILEDLQERKSRANEKNTMVVPLKPEDLPLDGGRESTMDDYDSVPIEKFGLAMLRGMGWKEDPNAPKKDNKFPEGPVQRPKGMGLGAERVSKDNNRQLIPPAKDEVLVMKKGAFVKVLAGKHKESYGTVESLDEENARVMIRFSIGGGQESLNEYLLQLVSNAEYKKYSKVLNNAKYEEFKNRTTGTSTTVKEERTTDRQTIKREPSPSPSPPRPSSSAKSQPSRSHRDNDQTQHAHRRYRSPETRDGERRHNHRDRHDREEHRRHERRSRSHEERRQDERHRRRQSSSSDGDTDSDSDDSNDRDRDRHHRRHKSSTSSSYGRTSSGTKKKSHKYKQRRDHSRERERERDRGHSSDDDDRHHKKKTKKSKKQRSRSRSRR
ncbi:G-patch domain and KOW motifs-containing protein-like [Armigeres subalbatus]|uniref:G-patch domain and KOW motifs-containing protein-like n=1 Tax=Armigeres subalbatus TaxID=124917 RepID=UPI002ED184FE